MEHFIEGVLELLFGLFKSKPDEMPDIEYKDSFIIKSNPKKIIRNIVASLVFVIGLSLLGFLFNPDVRFLFGIMIALGLFLLYFSLEALSFNFSVDTNTICQTSHFVFKKCFSWDDIICIRVIETTDESNVIIALYNKEKKCIIDVSSAMENAWQLVKMAEAKNIEIRKEKDLSIKQINRLQ